MRSLRKNLEAVPGKHSIDSLQKTVILGTSHIIRKVLQCEAWSLSGGDHRWFKRSTRKKRPVTGDIHIYNNNNNNNNNNNKPNIIIKNKNEKTRTLTDVAIPAERNVVQKEVEKKLEYKSLGIEIQRMWNLKCTIISVITGATGIVTRSWRKNLEAVPGKYSIGSLQKTASYTGDITQNTESTAVWNLKPERWGSPLVQEKCKEEKACDETIQVIKKNNNSNNNNFYNMYSLAKCLEFFLKLFISMH